MKYVILFLAALAHVIFLDVGSSSDSLQWLWNGIAFGVVWATAETVKEVLAKARLQVKYGLTEDSDWNDVLDALDSKCKYFKLARAMEDTRNDWNDGYGRVQWAISAFSVDSPEDQEIFDEIYDLAYEYEDIDGRIFRDCTHNYSFLYGKVDEELMKDYNTLREYYEAW